MIVEICVKNLIEKSRAEEIILDVVFVFHRSTSYSTPLNSIYIVEKYPRGNFHLGSNFFITPAKLE